MPSTYSNLKIQLMATGENNATWGDVTNLNLGTAIDEAIAGSAVVAFPSDADYTLPLTDSNASQPARNMRLSISGTLTAARNLIVPSIEKLYVVNNTTTQTIGIKNATGSTVSVPAGKSTWVCNNGSNVVDAVTHLTSLSVGSGLDVTGASTITASGASDALRITQTGAGNALVVEDSANPDASPFVLDGTGALFLGDSTLYTVGNTPKIQISSTGSGGSSINVITWSAASAGTSPTYNFARSRGATAGSYTAVASGDSLGGFSFYGSDGAGFFRAATITASTDGTPATGFVPGRITFSTGSSAGSPTERMRIASTGFVGINTVSPTQALSVGGGVGYNAPVTVAAATYTVGITDNWIIANNAGTVTLTLPAAASFSGRILTVKNVQAQLVVSASSNVVPIGSTTAGTAILAATAGKFATVVSDGTNWVVMQAN